MRSKTKSKLKMLLGAAAALGAAGHALAQTNAGSGGTIWLTVNDVTTGSSYLFDTGLAVSSFTGTGSGVVYTQTLSGANWTSFLATLDGGSLSTTDIMHYGVVSGAAASSSAPVLLDFTGIHTQNAVSDAKADTMWTQVNNFLGTVNNPSGGSSFFADSSPNTSGWYKGGYETNFNNAAGNTEWSGIGTGMAFYQVSNNLSGTTALGTASTFAGTWDLSTAGVLTYTVTSSTVPLPAPLLLLLSGLGLTGLVGRRGKPGSDETQANGAT